MQVPLVQGKVIVLQTWSVGSLVEMAFNKTHLEGCHDLIEGHLTEQDTC